VKATKKTLFHLAILPGKVCPLSQQVLTELPVYRQPRHGMLIHESTWEVCSAGQSRPAVKKVTLKFLTILFLLAAGLLTACTRPASRPAFVYATDSAPRIIIDKVQVNQGTGVYISGRSTLPDGECLKTELLADGKTADWWPREVCVTVDTGQWEMLVALGHKGAPNQLEPGAAYEIRAWWPQNPGQVSARFPFDLNGPKQ
jgi:hypothetical protein